MTGWTVREGGCRCDRVRIEVASAPLVTLACHCRGCQRMTGSAFSLSVAVPTEGFTVLRGETVLGGLHGPHRHHHCAFCLSWVYTRPAGVDWFVNVRTTMLDDGADLRPFVETMTCERLPWATTSALHSFERFPALEELEELVRAYAAHVARSDRPPEP